jgi:hypothetical protein
MGTNRAITIYWKDDDPRVDFLLKHLNISSIESLFSDLIEDSIDVWVDEHTGGNDECHLDDDPNMTATPAADGPGGTWAWPPARDGGPPVTHDGPATTAPGPVAGIPSSQLEPELRWTPDPSDPADEKGPSHAELPNPAEFETFHPQSAKAIKDAMRHNSTNPPEGR